MDFYCEDCGWRPVDMDEVECLDIYPEREEEFCNLHKECECGKQWLIIYRLVPVEMEPIGGVDE